ncbi:MAG: hypothetical protein LBB61_02345 [Treponema sp.]|jgi:hypothetical protein|nr:hypothetical protein [Treponema sp.]
MIFIPFEIKETVDMFLCHELDIRAITPAFPCWTVSPLPALKRGGV